MVGNTDASGADLPPAFFVASHAAFVNGHVLFLDGRNLALNAGGSSA